MGQPIDGSSEHVAAAPAGTDAYQANEAVGVWGCQQHKVVNEDI